MNALPSNKFLLDRTMAILNEYCDGLSFVEREIVSIKLALFINEEVLIPLLQSNIVELEKIDERIS